MPSSNLFPETSSEIKPDPDRPDPVVWIRRLFVVEGLSSDAQIIREVTLRRGLNIIRAAERPETEDRTVGHSIGKTLLVRLIRYCLGEQAYCTRAVRESIVKKLPDAYVVAESFVKGEPWIVARPLGIHSASSSSRAATGHDWTVFFSEDDHPFAAYLNVLGSVTAEPFRHVRLPHQDRPAHWLDLLAWMARDQNCRYRHHNEWRDPESESGTARLRLEDASLVIRMAMDLLDDEEIALKSRHDELRRETAELERRRQQLAHFLEVGQSEMTEVLGLSEELAPGELFAQQAVVAAEEKRQRATRELKAQQIDNAEFGTLADDLRRAEQAVGAASGEAKRLRGLLDAEEMVLRQLEAANQDVFLATFSQQVSWCPTFPTKEAARAAGCNWDGPQLKPGERDPRHEQKIVEVTTHIASLKEQVEDQEARLKESLQTRNETDRAYRNRLRERAKRTGQIRQEIGRLGSLLDQARRYRGQWAALNNVNSSLESQAKAIEASLEDQRRARAHLEKKCGALSEHFDQTLNQLLGAGAGGSVEIDARGIFPCPNEAVAATGEAMATSALVLGFDIACLIASVCGLGHLPRFLIHDSPREADMEAPMYHRLFHLAAQQEALFQGREPSFQYIVTTTTQPPTELSGDPYVRLTLDARADSELLFTTRF